MVRLAIDLGTSHTVAVVRRDDQPPRTLLFDGSPVLPSGVFAASDGALHTGRDAERLAQGEPERFEPHPKRRVDEAAVLLGGSEIPTPALLAAVLRRVAHEARQAGVDAAGATVLTYPADWGQQRRGVLIEAARLAGIGQVTLVDEPVAAATYCVDVLRQQVPVGRSLAVFDFGGGTLDLAVVRSEPQGCGSCPPVGSTTSAGSTSTPRWSAISASWSHCATRRPGTGSPTRATPSPSGNGAPSGPTYGRPRRCSRGPPRRRYTCRAAPRPST